MSKAKHTKGPKELHVFICPDCKELPTYEKVYMGYFVQCSCYDPTPDYSYEGLTGPLFYGHAETLEKAYQDWNDRITANQTILNVLEGDKDE